jgi:large-conductance mechanosensitive channel
LALPAILATLPLRLFADGTVSPPNPEGEKLYYQFLNTHFISQLLPFVILGCTILIICIALASQQHKARKRAQEHAGSYEI